MQYKHDCVIDFTVAGAALPGSILFPSSSSQTHWRRHLKYCKAALSHSLVHPRRNALLNTASMLCTLHYSGLACQRKWQMKTWSSCHSFHGCDKYLSGAIYKVERFVLAHGFRDCQWWTILWFLSLYPGRRPRKKGMVDRCSLSSS